VGWVVGHYYIVYGPLINETAVLFLKENLKTQMPVRFGEN
jgi:acyl-coenzyme A synthetase/AMP-(fatty) acid ligase